MNDLPASLLDYVAAQRRAGTPLETIRQQLGTHGWKAEDIEWALLEASSAQTDFLAKPPTTNPEPIQPGVIQNPTMNNQLNNTSRLNLNLLLYWFFKVGFASIFLINGIIALLRPAEFEALLGTFPIARAIGHIDIMVVLIGFNDLILGSLILSGKAKKFILAWAGFYLALVTMVKLVSLV